MKKRPRLGNYKLIKTIGEGNYSTVKLGEHLETGVRYAIKVHKTPEEGLDREDIEDILKEVRSIVKLQSHPNIVKIIEFIPETQVHYHDGKTKQVMYVIVEEFAKGGELYQYVADSGYFREPIARYFFQQIVEGAAFIH